MRARAKRLPRLWCALQGLLPLGAGWAAQPAEVVSTGKVDAAAEVGDKTRSRRATP